MDLRSVTAWFWLPEFTYRPGLQAQSSCTRSTPPTLRIYVYTLRYSQGLRTGGLVYFGHFAYPSYIHSRAAGRTLACEKTAPMAL